MKTEDQMKLERREKRINSELSIVAENYKVFLYNPKTKEVLSNRFDKIYPFENIDGKLLAKATRELKLYNIFNEKKEFVCYINLDGKIVSPVFNPVGNTFQIVSNEEFESYCINVYQQAIRELAVVPEEKVLTRLKRKIK